jgi:hypothetical protein
VRFVDQAPQTLGEPVIAPGLAAIAVHTLLGHDPASVIGGDEAMEIKVEPNLDGRAVDLGDQPTSPGERRAGGTEPVTDHNKLMRRLAQATAPPAANMDAKLSRQRCQAALQAPMTSVVIPEECQSIPITAPNNRVEQGVIINLTDRRAETSRRR